jgi:PAS domain S-box-containing protein
LHYSIGTGSINAEAPKPAFGFGEVVTPENFIMTSLLVSPLSTDDERLLTDRLLRGSAISVGATALVGGILIPLTAPTPLWGIYFATVGVMFVMCLLVLWLRQRGFIKAAGWVLIGVTWSVITTTALTSGGVYSSAYVGYVAVVMLAGLVLGRAASLFVTLATVLVALVMAIATLGGWLPPQTHAPLQWWAVSALLLSISAVIQQFSSHTLSTVVTRARHSEADYRALFEESPDGIMIANTHNQFELVNSAACQLLGVTPRELIGKRPVDIMAPEDLVRLPIGDPEDLRVLGGRKRERVIVNKSGARVTVIISSSYMADGRFQYTLQDITERKQAEAALRESENRFRTLVENLPDVFARYDRDLNFLYISPRGSLLSGKPSETFIGRRNHDLDIAPELAERWDAAIAQVFETGQSTSMEYELPLVKDVLFFEALAIPEHDEQGRLVSVLTVSRDVTRRIRAQEALKNSEDMYRRAIEAAGAVPYYLDYVTDRYRFVGDKMTEITGYPAEEIVPALMGAIEQEYQLLGEAAGLTKAEAVQLSRTGKIRVWKNDSRISTKSGESRWVSDTSVQVLDETGNATGAIGIVQDITERKQAELALRNSEELHRRAIEAAGAVPYYRDHIVGAYTLMGDGILPMTGYSPSEMSLQLFDSMVTERVMMGEAADFTSPDATVLARSGKLSVWQCDYKIKRRDGTYRWIADSAVEVLNENGISRGSVGILQDITERKEAMEEVQRLNADLEQRVAYRTEALSASEARFRGMNDASPLGIFVDDATGACVYSNAVYQDITGLTPEAALGSGWLSAVHVADRDSVVAAWDAAYRRTPFRYEQVYRVRRRDGRIAWVSVKASTMHSGETLLGYVGTLEDITVRVEAEDSLRRRTAQLEAANQELEAFSYSVSHDLRAPLRAIDGFSRLLLQEHGSALSPDAGRYLNKVRENTQGMSSLIDDLLEFSRLGRHSLRLQYMSSTDLDALVHRVANDACAAVPERRFKLFVGDLPPCEADLSLLTQVFVNLLTNAVKFTKPREVAKIEIGSLSADDGPAYFVRDNGVGFDMKYVQKVFGVFQRLHTAEEFEGTGVGMAIAQRIVQRHNGRIWAESVINRGTTFCFTIGKARMAEGL